MDSKSKSAYVIPSPHSPVWVPFPGSKRKAEEAFESDYHGPSCAKQFAIDDSVADPPPRNDGFRTEEEFSVDDSNTKAEDEEMQDLNNSDKIPFTSPDYAGVYHNTDEKSDEGAGLDEKERGFGLANDSTSNGLNNSPKLYFFEGLREVLLDKLNDDFSLQTRMMKNIPKPSNMAMMVWKPSPLSPQPLPNPLTSTLLSSPVDTRSQPPDNPQDEESGMEVLQ